MEINKLNVALFTTLTLAATTAAAADTYLTMGATTLKYKQQVSGLKLTSDSYALGFVLVNSHRTLFLKNFHTPLVTYHH
jgi:hypothetical protein